MRVYVPGLCCEMVGVKMLTKRSVTPVEAGWLCLLTCESIGPLTRYDMSIIFARTSTTTGIKKEAKRRNKWGWFVHKSTNQHCHVDETLRCMCEGSFVLITLHVLTRTVHLKRCAACFSVFVCRVLFFALCLHLPRCLHCRREGRVVGSIPRVGTTFGKWSQWRGLCSWPASRRSTFRSIAKW